MLVPRVMRVTPLLRHFVRIARSYMIYQFFLLFPTPKLADHLLSHTSPSSCLLELRPRPTLKKKIELVLGLAGN